MQRFGEVVRIMALAGMVSAAACAGDGKPEAGMSGATGTTGTAGTSADIDRKWVTEQLEDGDIEVRLGRLAQERGADADIRAFGAMMVEKHTMSGTELKRIATRHNITADPAHKPDTDAFDRLSKLTGRDFDRAYLETMVDEHEEAVRAIEDKARDNDEHADVKEWATKTLPDVQQHLERARTLRERLDRQRNQ